MKDKKEVKYVETLLLTIGFIGIIVFVLTPWTKTGFITAIASLSGYFYLAGLYSWTPVILFVIGIVCIVLEIFIPDFGLIGILGLVSVAFGLYYTTGDFGSMIRDLSLALVVSTILILILIRKGYSFSNLNKLILKTSSQQTRGIDETEEKIQVKVGMIGEAVTPLRPSGKVTFDHQKKDFDVLSSHGHIPSGTKVTIQEIHGTKIIVRKEK